MSSPVPNLTIRPCRSDELGAVLELWAESRSPHARTRDDLEVLERLLERDPESLLVAEIAGRVVAALIAAWDGWRGNMYRLAVTGVKRRQGIGLALVREGEARLHAKGARRVTALVAREDERARGLWRAAGYEDDEIIGRLVHNL